MASQANPPLQPPLASGTQLDQYRILQVLATGGFSVVYLAHDENEQPVAIKEYRFPADDAQKFNDGMRCFLEEGRALAHLQHPNLVRVLNFFRANDTVYLVMRYERGRTLLEHIRNRRGPMEEIWMRNTFAQLLNGLREVHTNRLLHLDIKPANVYIRNDGTPVLIDFGAARQTLAGGGMKLPPTYTVGFASPEQHTDREMLGPWSDIYSVGATMYATLAGEPPPSAETRLEKDTLVPARRAWRGKYSKELLDTIDWCLKVFHFERPQSVLGLQKALLGEKQPAAADHTVVTGLKAAIMKFRGQP